MQKQSKISLYDVLTIGLMAAMVFLATMFLGIKIATPTGVTMIKTGNILCLAAALLFGSWRGGLASGIGSALFDLTDPVFVYSAPFTFVRFFLMAWVCGKVAHIGGAKGKSAVLNSAGVILGTVVSVGLYIGKSIFELMIAGSAFQPALIASLPKVATSLVNGLTSSIIAFLIVPALRIALEKAGFMNRLAYKA